MSRRQRDEITLARALAGTKGKAVTARQLAGSDMSPTQARRILRRWAADGLVRVEKGWIAHSYRPGDGKRLAKIGKRDLW